MIAAPNLGPVSLDLSKPLRISHSARSKQSHVLRTCFDPSIAALNNL
jgi:hypothetical protein